MAVPDAAFINPQDGLREALMRGNFASVRSLRRDAHEASETCWLHGEDFCLSQLPPSKE